MEFGRFPPPNLYSLPTLRKAKQESKSKMMGIKYKCPVPSLLEFKHNSSLSGSIHSIGIDPFFVHYWTNYQIAVYKDTSREYVTTRVILLMTRESCGRLVANHEPRPKMVGASWIFVLQFVTRNEETNNNNKKKKHKTLFR